MRYQLTPIHCRRNRRRSSRGAAYGFHVGCKTAIALRDLGFDAKFMTGGYSAWKAIDGPTKPCV